MTLGDVSIPQRRYKPNPKIKGGSKPGKPQTAWPQILLVIAQAIYDSYLGTHETLAANRTSVPIEQFLEWMDHAAPGWREFRESMAKCKTDVGLLLYNRCYKAWYFGTSARNRSPNKDTRANMSVRHPNRKWGPYSPAQTLMASIQKNPMLVVSDWKDLAEVCDQNKFLAPLSELLVKMEITK
jgi:hypothetical protein